MNRIAGRSGIALLLVLVLVGGLVFFIGEYLLEAKEWINVAGSPHVYNGGNIGCGVVLDRNGELLLDTTDQRTYPESLSLRKSVIHWVGDREGNISAPALPNYSNALSGFDLINGIYSYAGTVGEAVLTLSARVQTVAMEALDGYKGTIAVYNYKTGEILCAVSAPSYDPDDVPDILGDTTGDYEGAIGQHHDAVNPCRFMTFMGVIAGGGSAAEPYLVSRVSAGGSTTYSAKTYTTGRLMTAGTAEKLREFMRNNVINSYGDENFSGLTVCAKSGTAELGDGRTSNAMFAGFCLDEAYPLAFFAAVEQGGYGGHTCVPIISQVLEVCKEVLDGE